MSTPSARKHGVSISGLGYYPNPLDPDPAVARVAVRPSQEGHPRRGEARPEERQHLRRPRLDEDGGRELAAVPQDLEAAHRLRRGSRHQDRHRELPDVLLARRMARRQEPRHHARHLAAHVQRHPLAELRPQLRPVALRPAADGPAQPAARVQAQALPPPRQGHDVHPERLNEVGIFAFPKEWHTPRIPGLGRHQLGAVHGGALRDRLRRPGVHRGRGRHLRQDTGRAEAGAPGRAECAGALSFEQRRREGAKKKGALSL